MGPLSVTGGYVELPGHEAEGYSPRDREGLVVCASLMTGAWIPWRF